MICEECHAATHENDCWGYPFCDGCGRIEDGLWYPVEEGGVEPPSERAIG